MNWCCIKKFPLAQDAGSANPWLQELPDPISKATWDNYALISMSNAKELFGLDLGNKNYEKKIMTTNIIRRNL